MGATPLPPTRTPRPTITPTRTIEPSKTLEATATLPIARSTHTVAAPRETVTPRETLTLTPTATRTRRPVFFTPTVAPLQVTNVLLIRVERNPNKENGAIAYIQVVYAGGRGPYTIFHDDTLQPDNPFQVLTVCNGTVVHTIIVNSADGQSITQGYYFEKVACPP
jgi:hypothetical protein